MPGKSGEMNPTSNAMGTLVDGLSAWRRHRGMDDLCPHHINILQGDGTAPAWQTRSFQ